MLQTTARRVKVSLLTNTVLMQTFLHRRIYTVARPRTSGNVLYTIEFTYVYPHMHIPYAYPHVHMHIMRQCDHLPRGHAV